MEFEDFRQGILESDLEVTVEQHENYDDVLEIEMIEVYEDETPIEYGMRTLYDALSFGEAEDWSEVDNQEVETYLTELSSYEGELNQDQTHLKNELNDYNKPGPEEFVEEWEEKGLLG